MNKNLTRVVWLDYLRVVACFMVVVAHSCDPFVGVFDLGSAEFLSGVAVGSLMRACVPLFVMVTAVLLVPVQEPTNLFYKKRLSRVLWPLFFWSVVTPVLYFAYVNGVGSNSPHINPAAFTLDATVNKILFFPLNFNYDTTPLWYLFMLVGLYLIMPIVSPWLREASKNELKIFLRIWAVTLILPMVKLLAPHIGYQGVWGSFDILGGCAWNPYTTFYYFAGFLGYVVLAFYLRKFPLGWTWRKTLAVCLPMFAVGAAITMGGFLFIQSIYPGDYNFLEIIWYFSGFNVFLMTFAIYVIFSKIAWRPSAFITTLSSLTFGVYLCHFLLVQVAYDIIHPIGLPPVVAILFIALMAFVMAAIVTYIIKKIVPGAKYIVG